jgi:hypothetical protein
MTNNGNIYYTSDTEFDSDIPVAKEAIDILHQFYPGHPWHVRVLGGVLQVQNLSFSSKWGMVLKLKDIASDALVRRRKLIWAAGEFLERANQRRRGWEESATGVEGIPQRQFGH